MTKAGCPSCQDSATWVNLWKVRGLLKSTACASQRVLRLQGKVGACLQQGAASRGSCQPWAGQEAAPCPCCPSEAMALQIHCHACPEVLGWSGGKRAQLWATEPVHVLGKGPQLASSQGTTQQCCSVGHETVGTPTCECCLQHSEGDFGLDVRHF